MSGLSYQNWILDFDDTLVVGPTTWGIEIALPGLIQRRNLPNDPDRLNAALLRALETVAREADDRILLQTFVNDMGWPPDVLQELGALMRAEFTFTLFPDTIPFLDYLRGQHTRIVVISNNNRAPRLAAELGIEGYIDHLVTPKMFEGGKDKPDRSMFDYARSFIPELGGDDTVVVGDDPWSDAVFAERCGLPCWIIDRRKHYETVRLGDRVIRVGSLDDIR